MDTKFFLDRSLGGKIVPQALRQAGRNVLTMSEHYGKVYAQRVPDVVWIRELTERGYALMTADHRTLVRPHERDAILAAGAIMFALPTGNLTGDQQADRFLRHTSRIHSAADESGPAGFVVYDRVVSLVLP